MRKVMSDGAMRDVNINAKRPLRELGFEPFDITTYASGKSPLRAQTVVVLLAAWLMR